jgi:hypothetical protein
MAARLLLLLSIVALAAAACQGPCDDVAERTCAKTGERDGLCLQLRKVAAAPNDRDRESCRAGKVFLDQLEKN